MEIDSITDIKDKNISSVYITPMLGGTRKLFFFTTHHINTYIFTEDYGSCIALHYDVASTVVFQKFLNAVKQFRMYQDVCYIGDTVFIIFDIPEEHKEDYNKFLKGEYSKFSVVLKDKILKFHGPSKYLVGVLYKSASLRQIMEEELDTSISEDSELESIPDINKESIFI